MRAGSVNHLATVLRNLPLRRKLATVIVIHIVMIVALLTLTYLGTSTLVGLRFFVGGEGLWSKSQKDAVYHLARYATTADDHDYRAYLNDIAVPLGDRVAFLELEKSAPDYAVVQRGFLQGRNHPDDLWLSGRLYRWFRHTPHMERAMKLWAEADRHVAELEQLAAGLHQELGAGTRIAPDRLAQVLARIDAINAALTPVENEFSQTLGAAARALQGLLLRIMLLAATVCIGTGLSVTLLLTRQISKGVCHLRAGAVRVADGDFSELIVINTGDELGELAAAFNQMTLSLVEMRRKVEEKTRELAGELADREQMIAARTSELASALRERENIMETIPDIIYMLDLNGNLVHWNRNLETFTGFSAEELMGKHVYALFATKDRPSIADAIRIGFAQGRFDVEGELLRKDRSRVSYHWTGAPLKDCQGRVIGLTGAGRDISERKSLEEQMAHQAFHDPLTSLPNRALFMDRLDLALPRAQRRGGFVAVLFLDLDRFKVINDSLGHQVGDQLLVAVAQRLQSCLRRGDTVARLGGDEFAILLAELDDFTDATSLAERISERLQAPLICAGRELFVTASIGIAMGRPGLDQPDDILRDADLAMYQAKHKGKAQYEVFHPSMSTPTRERLELETDLRRAVERGEFQVYYQPQVQLATGKIVEVEALIRWPHPKRGWMPPAEFIPLAEETGLIVPIGQWILEEACRQVRIWQAESPMAAPLIVSVNLSARQFQHDRLVEEIGRSLCRSGLDPTCLKLEITETVMMQDSDSTLCKLQQLKSLGIQLAVDDFGTGYSSLAYLKRFPVDTVKIDRSFVAGLGRSAEDTAIVHAVVTVAQALDLTVTAEGIETESQVTQLLALGCDQGQGYYFARPLAADAMATLLAGTLMVKEGQL